jgi:hypothetical protein
MLVLMGGGLVTAAAVPLLRGPNCDPVRPDSGACTSSTGSSSHYSGSSYGGTAARSGATGSGISTTAHGGFGAAGAAHASGGG